MSAIMAELVGALSSGSGSGGGSGGSGGWDPLDSLRDVGASGGKRRTDHRYDSSESSDSGVATLSPSSTSDTAPYSPSAESSCSSSDCSSTTSSTTPEQNQNHPKPPNSRSSTSLLGQDPRIMTAVSAVLAAADKRSLFSNVNLNLNLVNVKIGNCKVAAAAAVPPSSTTVANCLLVPNPKSSPPLPISGVGSTKCTTGKDLLAVAISFHHQQQLQEKAKQLNNNNSLTTLNKNNPPLQGQIGSNSNSTSSLPDLSLSHSPAPKKPRLDSSSSSPSKVKGGGGSVMPSLAKSSPITGSKKVKRKLVEEVSLSTEMTSTMTCTTSTTTGLGLVVADSVEASVVQGGRVCSVEESIKVKKYGLVSGSSSLTISSTGPRKGDNISCLWKGCCSPEAGHNLLEHIQTVHVSSQVKSEQGFLCLWEGCKVFNRKSSSRSWLERHVLFHSGNKPFKCIFPGCGQSFGVQGALERHVNSHMSTNGNGTLSSLTATKNKMDSTNSPFKGGRRKKQRCRKQRLNIGQHVDYFDKRVMELIKHRLATSISSHTASAHHCTFQGQVVAKRTVAGQEPQVLVQWFPPSIIPDEWMPFQEFRSEKVLPLTQLPKEKLPFIFPSLFPPRSVVGTGQPNATATTPPTSAVTPMTSSSTSSNALTATTTGGKDKARRKWSPSQPTITSKEQKQSNLHNHTKTQGHSSNSTGVKMSNKKPAPSSSSNCSASETEEDDWALDALLDNLFLSSVPSS